MKDVSWWVSKVNVREDVCSSPTFTPFTPWLDDARFLHPLVQNYAILRYCFLSNSGQRCWMKVNLWSAFSTAWLTFEPWLVCVRHKLHTCPLWGRSFNKTVEVMNALAYINKLIKKCGSFILGGITAHTGTRRMHYFAETIVLKCDVSLKFLQSLLYLSLFRVSGFKAVGYIIYS